MGISITGLSGFDTAKMVSDLMEVERIPYKNLSTKKTNLQSEQTVFRSINTAFSSLSTALNNLRYAADWNKLKATSDSNAVSVSSTNGVAAGSYTVNVQQLATKNVVEVDSSYILSKVEEAASSGQELKIGSYTFTAEDLQSIQDAGDSEAQLKKLANIINTNTAAENGSNATASVLKTSSSGDFKLVLNSKTTGAGDNNSVSFTLANSSIIDHNATDENGKIAVTNKEGKDAILEVNGVTVTRNSNTFDDLITGITFTVNSTGNSNINVGQDVDNIVANVKSFVTAYNNLISMVRNNLAKPEDDSKMNPLQGDSLLKQIDSQLYSLFNSVVDTSGGKAWMEQVGLSIDKGITKGSEMTGKITFDEEAFKEALANDPQKVIELFTKPQQEADPDTATPAKPGGIITELTSIMGYYNSTVNGMLNTKITGYDAEIKMIDDRMEQMERRLEMTEARLKLQFGTMETMLSTLNSQKDWLTSQFDALTKK